jgi:SOS response regulatory protein OraA/RecX
VTDEQTRAATDPVEVAVRALTHRDLTAHELATRLAREGVSEAELEVTLDRLGRAGYVDDARFAMDRARTLAARGRGDAAIRADLDQRGVDPERAEHALAGLEPEPERARRLVLQLGGGARAARALARNGFSEESLETALPGLVAPDP